MRVFLDLGTNQFQGLEEFTIKLNLDNNTIVYCYEANTMVFNQSIDKKKMIETNYKKLNHYHKAVMDYSGVITFNSHRGAWLSGNFIPDYTGGSNALNINPLGDPVNGCIFDIHQEEIECIDINDILNNIITENPDAELYIKCDIEGSEFKVLPRLLESSNIKYIKEIHIEWHERFFENTENYNEICFLKKDIINKFNSNGICCYDHH
jgi:FkbM family methyltransferase